MIIRCVVSIRRTTCCSSCGFCVGSPQELYSRIECSAALSLSGWIGSALDQRLPLETAFSYIIHSNLNCIDRGELAITTQAREQLPASGREDIGFWREGGDVTRAIW